MFGGKHLSCDLPPARQTCCLQRRSRLGTARHRFGGEPSRRRLRPSERASWRTQWRRKRRRCRPQRRRPP
eukprot:5541330-Prymnesium_polylepis.1